VSTASPADRRAQYSLGLIAETPSSLVHVRARLHRPYAPHQGNSHRAGGLPAWHLCHQARVAAAHIVYLRDHLHRRWPETTPAGSLEAAGQPALNGQQSPPHISCTVFSAPAPASSVRRGRAYCWPISREQWVCRLLPVAGTRLKMYRSLDWQDESEAFTRQPGVLSGTQDRMARRKRWLGYL
jgi:hypothetical protein